MLYDRVSCFTSSPLPSFFSLVVVSWDIHLFSVDRHSVELCNIVLKIFLTSTWMITEFADECRNNTFTADDKAQKGIRDGRLAWKFVVVTVLCSSLAWCFCRIGQANYNSLHFACFHSLLWKKLEYFAKIVKSYSSQKQYGKRQTACVVDLRRHRRKRVRLNLNNVRSFTFYDKTSDM